MNTKIDRDEIRSQLKEGLIHTRKILKNKKGKKNEDLIFTLGTKQFLINRCDVGSAWGDEKAYKSPSCFFMQDSERRERAIKLYLDDEICSNRDGSKDLSLYLVGDMTKNARRGGEHGEWRLNSASLGIRMPFNVKSQGGFSVSDLDVLIADDVDKQTSSLCIMKDCDDDGLYQGKKRKEVNYLDVLVDRVIYYLDDDYMSECYETNKKFYDEFTKMVTNAIYNGWKESYLTDLGKGIITEKFLENLSTDKFGSKSVNFELETLEFKRRFNDTHDVGSKGVGLSFVTLLEETNVIPSAEDFLPDCTDTDVSGSDRYGRQTYSNKYLKTAWERTEKNFLKEVA